MDKQPAMSDLVERLRDPVDDGISLTMCHMLDEAADTITRLRAELAEARDKALDEAAFTSIGALWPILGGNHTDAETWQQIGEAIAQAIRALKSPPPL